MEHKLKAITMNVCNDTIISTASTFIETNKKISQKVESGHERLTDKTVPCLFSTERGLYLKKFNRALPNNCQINFCDLEKFSARTITDSIGLTPSSLIKSMNSNGSASFSSSGKVIMVRERNPHNNEYG